MDNFISQAEASRSALPPISCDLTPRVLGTPTHVVVEAGDVGKPILEWARSTILVVLVLAWFYVGALLVNWAFPL